MLLVAKLWLGLETWNKSSTIDIDVNDNACGRVGCIQPTTNSNRCIELQAVGKYPIIYTC